MFELDEEEDDCLVEEEESDDEEEAGFLFEENFNFFDKDNEDIRIHFDLPPLNLYPFSHFSHVTNSGQYLQ